MDDSTPPQDKKIPSEQPVVNPQPVDPHAPVQYAAQNMTPTPDYGPIQTPADNSSFLSRNAGLISMLQLVVGAIALAAIINSFVFQSYQVFGMSMANTLHEGDRLVISKVSKSLARITGDYVPTRGDIIVFASPLSPDVQLIKRVIALPGERVVVKKGIITVYNDDSPNGFNPDADYKQLLPENKSGDIETVVGEAEIFVAGDNRISGASLDSRNDLGNIPIDNVVGELVMRVFPLDKAYIF